MQIFKSPAVIKIIVTDDHSLFRNGVINSLKKYPDLEIIGETENGVQLLDLLKIKKPDAITLNVAMPILNGPETMRILRKEYPDIKVIALSMHESHGVICEMMRAGANAYLTKECGGKEIYAAIKACMEHSLFINETITRAFREELNANTIPEPVCYTPNQIRIMEMLAQGQEVSGLPVKLGMTPVKMELQIQKLICITRSGDLNGLRNWVLKNLDK